MDELTIQTEKRRQVVDITTKIEAIARKAGWKNGLCQVFVKHTTAALTTADLDPGTDLDLLDALQAMLPKLKYRHPHDPAHVGDHILSSVIGPAVSLPVREGKLQLGTWQRLVLVELNGPKECTILISFIKEQLA